MNCPSMFFWLHLGTDKHRSRLERNTKKPWIPLRCEVALFSRRFGVVFRSVEIWVVDGSVPMGVEKPWIQLRCEVALFSKQFGVVFRSVEVWVVDGSVVGMVGSKVSVQFGFGHKPHDFLQFSMTHWVEHWLTDAWQLAVDCTSLQTLTTSKLMIILPSCPTHDMFPLSASETWVINKVE